MYEKQEKESATVHVNRPRRIRNKNKCREDERKTRQPIDYVHANGRGREKVVRKPPR